MAVFACMLWQFFVAQRSAGCAGVVGIREGIALVQRVYELSNKVVVNVVILQSSFFVVYFRP
jgi:hypothetical protein